MARDVQTTATLSAKTKGFAEVAQQAAKINKAAAAAAKDQLKSSEDVGKSFGKTMSQLKKLAGLQRDLNREMGEAKKGGEAYKELARRSEEATKQQEKLRESLRKTGTELRGQNQAVTAAQMARGGFIQGLIQGGVPGAGPFIQRGPGMGMQVAGMGAGRAVRGVAGGMARAPFSGLQGIGQALSAIPGGGFLGGPMMLAAAQAGPALAFRGALQQAMPFLGTERLQARTRARVARAGQGFTEADIKLTAKDAEIEARAHAPVLKEAAGKRAYAAKVEAMEAARDVRLGKATAERREAFGEITGPGVALAGMAKPEAFQFAAQIARIGGGQAMEMPRQFFQAAFAAKTLYGAGPEVSGAFMQAGRRGGLVGGVGRGGDAMTEAIGQADSMGLVGSEALDFLGIIAGGIQDWKRTGIPMNTGSIAGIARGVGASIGAVRGVAVAQGIAGAARGLAMGGPQSAIDMMMLQAVGYRGGGAEAFEEAQIALEKGKFGAEETGRLMERLTGMGGGGAAGRQFARGMLRQKGIQVSATEMRRIEQEGIGEIPGVTTKTGELVKRAAGGAVDPFVQRQAAITNKQLEAGQKMLHSTQDAAEGSALLAKTFTEELGPALKDLTGFILELTKALPDLIEKVKGMGVSGVGLAYGKALVAPWTLFTGDDG